MLELQKAIKKIIERFIAQMIPITVATTPGSNFISVQSSRRFQIGDQVVLRHTDPRRMEIHCVKLIPDNQSLLFQDNVTERWEANTSYAQKLIGWQAGNQEFLKAIYLGDPAVIPQFPAITIDAKSLSSEWLTLESTSEKFQIDITVYVDGSANYDAQYELMHYYVDSIRRALFRSLYPLAKPYRITTLAEDAAAEDDFIKVSDTDFFQCGMGWIFLESVDFLVPNRAIKDLGSGVLQLVKPIGRDFAAGDSIIHPLRHIYDTLPSDVTYGTINKNTVLKAARISYRASEEVRRYEAGYIDPISF